LQCEDVNPYELKPVLAGSIRSSASLCSARLYPVLFSFKEEDHKLPAWPVPGEERQKGQDDGCAPHSCLTPCLISKGVSAALAFLVLAGIVLVVARTVVADSAGSGTAFHLLGRFLAAAGVTDTLAHTFDRGSVAVGSLALLESSCSEVWRRAR